MVPMGFSASLNWFFLLAGIKRIALYPRTVDKYMLAKFRKSAQGPTEKLLSQTLLDSLCTHFTANALKILPRSQREQSLYNKVL